MAKPLNLIQSLNQLKAQLSGGAAASDEAMTLIKDADKVGKRKVLHMSGNVLDVDMTLDGIQFCSETGEQSAGEDCKTLDDVLAKPNARPACVITGRPLRGNKTTTDPVIDWNGVHEDLQGAAAYAATLNQIGSSLSEAEQIVYQLKLSPLPPPWPTRRKDWIALRDEKNPTVEQSLLRARVLDRFKFKGVPGQTASPRQTERVIEREQNTILAGDVVESRPRQTETERPTPPRPEPTPVIGSGAYRPKVVILIADDSPKDEAMARELIKHMGVGQRQIGYDLWCTTMFRPGAVVGEETEAGIQNADIFLHLCSVDLFSGTVRGRYDLPQTLKDRFPSEAGYRHIPILLRPVTLPVFLQGAGPLPSNGKPVTDWRDSDQALGEIASGISDVVRFMINNPTKRPRR